jgi:cytochrome c biogenesis protein CcdA
VKTKNILGFIGIALALVGGYLWMINYISIALILWGLTFLIVLRLKKMNKNKVNRRSRLKDRY